MTRIHSFEFPDTYIAGQTTRLIEGMELMDADSAKDDRDETGPFEIPPGITLDVAEKFCPLRTDVSDSWRTTLQEIQQRFSECAPNQTELKCVLTHSVVPEWPQRPDGPYPSEVEGMEPIAMGGGPSRWPQQLFRRTEDDQETIVSELTPMSGKSYRLKMLDISSKLQLGDVHFEPIVGNRPVHNITGNPILYSDGQPVGMRQGINRNYFVHAGGAPQDRITSITSFFELAALAGQCLYGLPADVNRVLWNQWLDGFSTIGDKGMWISALFELAWQQAPGSSLAAGRFAWSGTTSIPLDPLPQLQPKAEGIAPIDAQVDTSEAAAHWYSVIDDLVSASVAAVDVLLALGDDDRSGQGEPASVDA